MNKTFFAGVAVIIAALTATAVEHRHGTDNPQPAGGRYQRAAFGPPWTDDTIATGGHNGCRTREDILARDLTTIRRDRCHVSAGVLHDPYTGHTITFTDATPSAVQIDHIVPLAWAWNHGADQWPAPMRVRFANDPANLLAVDGHTNRVKSDQDPTTWLPATGYRCRYAQQWLDVTGAYHLHLPAETADRITTVIRTCTGGTR